MASCRIIREVLKMKASIFRRTVLDCLGNTSIHAVPKAVKSEEIVLKIFWLVCVVISASLCAFLLVSGLLNYLNYDVVSVSDIEREVPQVFPTLTLCNSNPFVTESGIAEMKKTYDDLLYLVVNADDKDYEDLVAKYANSSGGISSSNVTLNRGYLDSVEQIAKTEIYLNTNLSAAQRKGLGLTIEQMLISCYFGFKSCSANDFDYFYDVNLGNCYRFNSGRNRSLRTTKIPGHQYGLKLELYVGYTPASDYYSYSAGVFVAIHSSTETPLIPDDGIDLPTGRVNDLEITKSVYRLLETPNSYCVQDVRSPSAFNSDLYRATFLFTKQYNQEICYKMCIQKGVIKKCNCYDITYPSMNLSSTPCRLEDIYCVRESLATLSSDEFLATNCDPYCPFECETVLYDHSLTGNRYPTDGYANLLYQTSSLNFSSYVDSPATLKQSILQLNVFYGSLSFRVESELRAMPILVFLSNVGGTLGLFLGFSLLSLLEIFELAFMLVLNVCHRRKKVKDESRVEDFKE